MSALEAAIRRIPWQAEVVLVVLFAFGLFSTSSVASALSMLAAPNLGAAPHAEISERSVIGVLGYEAVMIVVLGWFLGLRGWTLARLGFQPGWRTTLVGVGIAIAGYVVLGVLSFSVQ